MAWKVREADLEGNPGAVQLAKIESVDEDGNVAALAYRSFGPGESVPDEYVEEVIERMRNDENDHLWSILEEVDAESVDPEPESEPVAEPVAPVEEPVVAPPAVPAEPVSEPVTETDNSVASEETPAEAGEPVVVVEENGDGASEEEADPSSDADDAIGGDNPFSFA